MATDTAQVTVRILDKEYQVACPVEERTDLLDAASFLDAQMRQVRESGRVVGLERIAVMVALNIANELLRAQGRESGLETSVLTRLKALNDRAERAIGDARQLDL
ncbi:MAG: cell division protein ZapA [Pseudomonadota bacterium]